MSAADPPITASTHGDVLTAISDGMVALLKEFTAAGRRARKSYFQDDLVVVCLLRGGFSTVERTLLEGGRGAAVIQQRMEFQDLMRDRFEAVIKTATGREVIGFMSGNQQDPDIMCEVSSSPRPTCSTTATARSPRAPSRTDVPDSPPSRWAAATHRPTPRDCVAVMNTACGRPGQSVS